jgi:hypothetical protein
MVTPIKIEISLSDLLDVINSHTNPLVAMAILDGTYVSSLQDEDLEPRYHKNHHIKKDDDTLDHYSLLFQGYNKWSDEVTFRKDNPKAWSRTDTMSLQEWRAARDFNPYPLDWSESTPGLV